MKQCYQRINFRAEARSIIEQADAVLTQYNKDGFDMTLRQLYYYFVSHNLFPETRRWTRIPGTNKWKRDPNGTKNADPNYMWLSVVLNNGRLAGMLDWDMMVDRTREVQTVGHWKNPAEIITMCSRAFRIDTRSDQRKYIEIWVEKDALSGVVEPAARRLDVSCLIDRGFVSQSAMYQAFQRFQEHEEAGQQCIVIYLGDHDPSGICMNEDIFSRLNEVFGVTVVVERIALTMAQIKSYNPPPDPAKQSDSRFKDYQRKFGDKSWELDSLDPKTLDRIITEAVNKHTDQKKLQARKAIQEDMREQLIAITTKLEENPDWRP